MKTYKIEYVFDGCTWCDFVEAETPEKANEYFCWIKESDYKILKTEESDEIASFYCPADWERPESISEAKVRSKQEYLKRYLPEFYENGRIYESEKLKEKLLADGWERKIESFDFHGFVCQADYVEYTRGNETINAFIRNET